MLHPIRRSLVFHLFLNRQQYFLQITSHGGQCIAVQCDHGEDDQVKGVFEKIKQEQDGILDVLVNNAYGGVVVGLLSPSGP